MNVDTLIDRLITLRGRLAARSPDRGPNGGEVKSNSTKTNKENQ